MAIQAMSDRRMRRAFRIRRWTIVFVGLLLVVVFVQVKLKALSSEWLIVAVVAAVCLSKAAWRCPRCNSELGVVFVADTCPSCHTYLGSKDVDRTLQVK